jgi:hypothetical protein
MPSEQIAIPECDVNSILFFNNNWKVVYTLYWSQEKGSNRCNSSV